jgi:hypothetical protein
MLIVSPIKKSAGTNKSLVPSLITAYHFRNTPYGVPAFVTLGSLIMIVESSR